MNLDFPTLAVVTFMLSIGLAVAFSLLLLVLRGQPVLRLWTASLWLGAGSVTLVALRPYMPEVLSIMAGNACAALSWVLLLGGLALHVGHRGMVYRPALVLAALYLCGIGYFSMVRPDLGARLALYGLTTVVWNLWAIRLLLHDVPAGTRTSRRLAAAAFAADAALYVARLFMPVAPDAHQDIMRAGLPVQVTYLVGTLLVLAPVFRAGAADRGAANGGLAHDGAPRRAHRAGQPRDPVVRGPTPARTRPRARQPVGGVDAGPGPLQGHQRHLGPCHRR